MSQPDDDPGRTALHVDTSALSSVIVTRVTVEAAGTSQDLTPDLSFPNRFIGTVILPAGMQTLVASAFSGAVLVGRSQPTPVDVRADGVSQAFLNILDTQTPGQPLFGPIISGVTFPMMIRAGESATFVVSAISPSAAAISYDWTTSCADSAFAGPHSAMTGWSKPTAGTCTISASATSLGLSTTRSFTIIVFPATGDGGAVDVQAFYTAAPSLFLSFGSLHCAVAPDSVNASCEATIASPTVTPFNAGLTNFGNILGGSFSVVDDCGGRFGVISHSESGQSGYWLPPIAGGLCTFTAHAVDPFGLTATLSAAVVALPGTPAVGQPPRISGGVHGNGSACSLLTGTPDECGPFSRGEQLDVFGDINWQDSFPGSLTLTDSCAGGSIAFSTFNGTQFQTSMTLSAAPGTSCLTTMRATNIAGVTTEASGHYTIRTPH